MTPGESQRVMYRRLYIGENATGWQEEHSDGNPPCDADMLTPRIIIRVRRTDTRQAASAIFC